MLYYNIIKESNMATSNKSNLTVSELKKANSQLVSENAKLKKQMTEILNKPDKRNKIWKNLIIFVCIAFAGAILVAGNLLFWVGNTIVETNKFVATVNPLIEEPAVQQGIASYTTNQLFTRFNVEQSLTDVLPPRADFLAPTLTNQLKSTTQSSLEKILSNDSKFQTIWKDTIKTSHEKLIGYIRQYEGNGTITINSIYKSLSDELQNTKLSFLANKNLPASVGSITVANFPYLPLAHNVVNYLGLYQSIAIFLLIGFSVIAIVLSANKRKTVIVIGIMFTIFMALSILAIRIVVYSVTNLAQSDYRNAIGALANIIADPLISQTLMLLLLGILIAAVAWISGPYKVAILTRKRVKTLFEGNIHQAIFSSGENNFTMWVGSHRQILQWSAVAIVAFIMLIVELSPILVFWYALLILLLVLLVEMLAAKLH